MSEKRYGRWASGDIAEERGTGKLYRVTGFILNPAVCFSEIGGDGRFVEVAGCPNELSRLIHYGKEEGADDWKVE